jgi:enolase
MADRFYSVSLGEQMEHQVTEGASTSAEAIELRVNDTVYATKLQVLLALEAIENYLATKETSPIA